jgi:hypothetical protein
MHKRLIVLVFLILSCKEKRSQQVNILETPVTLIDTSKMILEDPPVITAMIPDTLRIYGEFNGDHFEDEACAVLHHGNKYIIYFSSDSIRPLHLGQGRVRLVNEGDLNHDGRDDLSIFQESGRGCFYKVSTWSFSGQGWKRITKVWRLPYFCDYVSDEELQNRIVLEDGTVYYYDTDEKEEAFSLIKKEMVLW